MARLLAPSFSANLVVFRGGAAVADWPGDDSPAFLPLYGVLLSLRSFRCGVECSAETLQDAVCGGRNMTPAAGCPWADAVVVCDEKHAEAAASTRQASVSLHSLQLYRPRSVLLGDMDVAKITHLE